MVIGVCLLDIHIPHSRSLKDKRMIIKGIKESLSNRYNISIAEIDFQSLWQRSKIAVVAVANSKKVVEQTFSSVLNYIEGNGNCQLTNISTDYLV